MSDDDLPEIRPEGEEHVYMVVADHIEAQIVRGEIRVGARIPGQLAIAERYGIARMTASRALRELRDRGLVRYVVGKGHYVIEQRRNGERD